MRVVSHPSPPSGSGKRFRYFLSPGFYTWRCVGFREKNFTLGVVSVDPFEFFLGLHYPLPPPPYTSSYNFVLYSFSENFNHNGDQRFCKVYYIYYRGGGRPKSLNRAERTSKLFLVLEGEVFLLLEIQFK